MELSTHIKGASAVFAAADDMVGTLDAIATRADDAPLLLGRRAAIRAIAGEFEPQLEALRTVRATTPLSAPLRDAFDGALLKLELVSSQLAKGSRRGARDSIAGARTAAVGTPTS